VSTGLVPAPFDADRISELDHHIVSFLQGTAPRSFDVIGAGELTCVIGWRGFAFKLLPPVDDLRRVEAYGALLDEYLIALRAAGVPIVDTSFAVATTDRGSAGYIIQPRLPGEQLLSVVCQRSDVQTCVGYFERLLDHVDACVTAGIGIDPQLSNWMLIDGTPQLVDVTTPMLRDAQGRDRLDAEFFIALLPRVLQSVARRFLLADLLDKNFDHRKIVLDLIGNMANYGLSHLTEPFVEVANARLAQPLSVADVRSYRKEDKATWWLLRRAFAAEQVWRRLTRAPVRHLVPAYLDTVKG